MPFSCIIIDDDKFALEQLKEYIDLSPYLRLEKAFVDPFSALDFIKSLHNPIDILFTDVEMPGLSGLKLAEQLNDKIRLLILVSSHLHYAIDGYNVNAQQFLSKPFNYQKFEQIIENIRHKIPPPEEYITIKLSGKNQAVKVLLKDIIYIESAANYLKVITKTKTLVPYGSLHSMQQALLPQANFLRISRSLIININFISSTNRYQIKLSEDIVLSVGESYQKTYDKYFKDQISK